MVLYQAVYQDLRNEIIDGELDIKPELPSGKDLMYAYGASWVTVWHGFQHLSDDNLIETHKGNGLFASHHSAVQSLDPICDFGEIVSKTGFEVLSKVLSFNEITESSEVGKSHGHSVGVGDLPSCVKDTCSRIAQQLQKRRESQTLQIKRLTHDGSGRPIDFENLRARTDAFQLGIRVQRW